MAQNFDPKKVALAIITFYPSWYSGKRRSFKHNDKVRGDLAIETLTRAAKKGYNIIVVDGKSSRTFHKAISDITGLIIGKRRSIKASPAKRQAIRRASHIAGVEAIVMMEPEKTSLINQIPKIAEPILKEEADVVVPKRQDELFKKTYPDYQYESEVEGNRVYNEELRSHELISVHEPDLDFFFGPRAFRNKRNIRSLFTKKYHFSLLNITLPKEYFDPEAISNTLFFPIITALQKKLKVVSVAVPFEYPPTQKANESTGSRRYFIEKRKAQFLSLTVELLHFIGYMEKYKARIKSMKN